MPPAFEGSGEPDFDDAQGEVARDHALTQRKHVRVVVLAGKARGVFVPAQGTTHAADLVRNDGFPIAGAAEDDAAVALAASDRFRRWTDEIGIIHRFAAEG